MSQTIIEWTDVTDNIIAVKGGGWWCRKISPGCANCYAAKLNQNSFYGGNKLAYSGDVPNLILRRDIIDGWARQRKSKKHFVASMTDVFGDWVPQEWVDDFLTGMMLAPKQTFQVLTKRPGVANQRIRDFLSRKGIKHLTANIWIGTSVENQECAESRIPHLLSIPAKVRFLSCEPLLGDLDLHSTIFNQVSGIHWVICGGESGSKARPMHPEWLRSLRDQCQRSGVSFFFKQWGEWGPCEPPVVTNIAGKLQTTRSWKSSARYVQCLETGQWAKRIGKKAAGRLLDGREWSQFPALSHDF